VLRQQARDRLGGPTQINGLLGKEAPETAQAQAQAQASRNQSLRHVTPHSAAAAAAAARAASCRSGRQRCVLLSDSDFLPAFLGPYLSHRVHLAAAHPAYR
jgi:hypothetical protein